jgi:hypothetical protein
MVSRAGSAAFVAGYPMTTKLKTPEGRNEREGNRFDKWEGYGVAAIIVITMIIFLSSTSPRTALYSVMLILLIGGGVLAFVSWFTADRD